MLPLGIQEFIVLCSVFSEWICHLHRQPCHVVYTDYRPTPLQHFIYSAGADGLYEVVNVQVRTKTRTGKLRPLN